MTESFLNTALFSYIMIKEVCAGKYIVSSYDLMARTSQCVGLGAILSDRILGGLANIHSQNEHVQLLDAFFEELTTGGMSIPNTKIALIGGVDAFVPQKGLIPGKANAERILDYLSKNNLESAIIEKDLFTDYIRKMFVYPKQHYIKIARLKE